MPGNHEVRSASLSRRAAAWCVAVLTLAALCVRLVGIEHQLPHKPEPDAVIVWQAAWIDRPPGTIETDIAWQAPFYPDLLSRTLAALPGDSFARPLPNEATLEEHLAQAARPYLRARWMVALLSVLLIPATYQLARRFLARAPAVFSAALVATSVLDTFYAQQARPHAASATLTAFAVVLALRHLRKGGLASLALASAAAFVALGALHMGVFALPPLFLAWWFAPRRKLLGILVPVLAAAASIACFYRAILAAALKDSTQEKLDLGGQTLTWEQISFDGLRQIGSGFWGFDPVASALAIAGIVLAIVALARRTHAVDRRLLLVTLSAPLAFIVFWSVMQVVWARFLLQIFPFAAVLGGVAFLAATSLRSRTSRRLATALVVLPLAFPAFVCVKLAVVRSRDDTQTLAARWVEAHADREHDRIGLHFLWPLPLLRTRASIERLPIWARGPWEQYQLRLAGDGASGAWKLVPLFTTGDLADKKLERAEVLRVLAAEPCRIAITPRRASEGGVEDETRATLRETFGPPREVWTPYAEEDDERYADTYELPHLDRILARRLWGPALEGYAQP